MIDKGRSNQIVYLVILLCLSECASGANILVLEGLASPSHHVFLRVLNEALAAQGHNVTSISADIEQNPVANLTYLHNDKAYEAVYANQDDLNFMNFGETSDIGTIFDVEDYHLKSLRGIVISQGYQKLLSYPDDFKFDLIIHDYMAMPLLLGFHHKFHEPPLVGISAFHRFSPTHPVAGSLYYPSFIPFHFSSSFTETFAGRVRNFFLYFFDHFYREYHTLPAIYEILSRDFPKLPPLGDLERQTRITLVNYSPAIHDPEPILPNVIPIAGMHMQEVKPLTSEFQKILDSATDGLIFFSLGTNVKSWMLGEEIIQKFIEAFRQLPQYTILWKFDTDKIKNVPKNVIIKKWVPQNDILSHSNTKLFMSHCGLLSSLEAAWQGVPILAVPIFLDQNINAAEVIRAGLSEAMNIRDFTSDEVKNLIFKMMTSSKYQKNSDTRSHLFKDQPQPPLQKTLWWINFVLRNPDIEFLQSKSKHMNILILHNIDVIAFFLFIVLFALYIAKKILSFLLKTNPDMKKDAIKPKKS